MKLWASAPPITGKSFLLVGKRNLSFLRHALPIALAIIISYALAGQAQAVIAFVQQNYATPQSPESTAGVAFTKAQTAGNLNVVVVGWNDTTATVRSVTDSKGNVYTLAVGPTVLSGQLSQAIYYAKNIQAAAANTNTVTVQFNMAANYADIRILEYSGLDATNPVDAAAAATGTTATSNGGAATTTNANDLIFGANTVSTATTGPGSGFTKRVITNPDSDIAEDRIVSAVSSYSAAASLTSAGPWVMQTVAFRAALGGPPSITSPLASSATVGVAYSYQIAATNNPTGFNAATLPAGLSVNTNTGLISGTPTVSGSYNVQLSATNPVGTGSAVLALTVGAADTTAPSIPTGLSATAVSSSQINLSWTASTDPDNPASQISYTVYRNGTQVGTTTAGTTSYADTGLTASTSYTYAVSASDPSHNTSAQSAGVIGTTLAASNIPTFVQQNYATPQSSKSTVPVTFTNAQTAGDLNVVVVGWNDTTATVSSVTDAKGNVYTLAVGPTVLSGKLSQAIYYAKNIQAAVANTNTVTVQFNMAAAYPDIRLFEFSGINAANPVDVTAAATGATAMSSSGAATTTNGSDLIFGANMVSTTTSGPGPGFTSLIITSPDGDIAEDATAFAVGSYSATAPLTSAGPWVMQMVAFRGAGVANPPPPPPAPALVTTYHYDTLRTGWNNQETMLAASSFPSTFGILKTVQLDDQVDAQPLVVPGSQIANGSLTADDVIYVPTGSNTVYAIDASTGAILLSRNLGSPVPNPLGNGNNGPNVGIYSTPVIDLNSQTLFLIAYVSTSSTPTYYLHALDLSTLKDKINFNPPTGVLITASHYEVNGSIYTFNAGVQKQRAALLLQNGNVYAGFGSFGDYAADQSRGWLLGWNATTLQPLPGQQPDGTANQLNDTQTTDPGVNPPFFLSGIWMSGGGIAGDGSNLYFSTGNSDCNDIIVSSKPCPSKSTWTGTTNIQESVAQFSNSLVLGGIFTPSNTFALDQGDLDLSAGGVLLFPTATYPYLAAADGKDGRLFLLNPANLGQPTNTSPPTSTPPALDTQQDDPCWCGPSFFVGEDGISRIVTSHGNTLRTWPVRIPLVPEAAATIAASEQDPGFFTSISSQSSDGTRYGKAKPGSAIIWAVGRPTGVGQNPTAVTLYAFDARPSGSSPTFKKLFSAPAGSWPNTGGNANIVPVVFDGKVYVASAYLDASGNTRGQLNIFGIAGTGAPLASAVAAPASPYLVSGTVTAVSNSTATLRTRKGRAMTIDLSQAKRNLRIPVRLKVGGALTALGSMIEGNGALLATSVFRPKGSSGDLWPADH